MAASLWKDKCPGHPGLTSDYLQALIACRDWDEVKAVSQFAMKVQVCKSDTRPVLVPMCVLSHKLATVAQGQTPKLVTVRGQCLLYTGQIAPARQCFKKALQDDPDFKDAQVPHLSPENSNHFALLISSFSSLARGGREQLCVCASCYQYKSGPFEEHFEG